uniref:Putative alcohol dehydrogenase transcription factor myb/sant-like protein n=1 Tax=Culex tarsalis TaxID=7177 RepID=A0A1Q3EVY2_CULTA
MEDLDTEQFIEEVRKRTAIWDSSSDDYKNRDLKKNQWAEVCMVLYPDFLGLDANDRLRTVMELQSKWKHIRDSYVRSLRMKRTKSGRRTAKNYVYARQLEFLRAITTSRRTTECSPEQPEVLVNSVDEFEYFGNVIEDTGGGVGVGVGIVGNGNVEVGTGDGGGGGQSSVGMPQDGEDKSENGEPSRKYSTSTTQRRRRRATFMEQNVRNYIDSYDRERMDRVEEPNSCDDMDFFRSMLPLIQVLPLYERMKFRMDVMRIGLEYFEKSRALVQYSE